MISKETEICKQRRRTQSDDKGSYELKWSIFFSNNATFHRVRQYHINYDVRGSTADDAT